MVLVEDGGEVVDQIALEVNDPILTEVSEGDILLLWFDDKGDLVAVECLPEETRRRRRNRGQFGDLSERPDHPRGGVVA